MKTALIKNTLREIKSSLGRFISIALMISLGSFSYVGLKSASPDMEYTLNEFSKETNMSHLVIQFTTGIEEKDKNKILEYNQILEAEFLKSIELKTKEDEKLINLIELPEKISRPKVLKGRYPENKGELLLDNSLNGEYNIGDKILFKKEEKSLNFNLDDTSINGNKKEENENINKDEKNIENLRLEKYEYEIVGFCITPEYLGELDKGRSFSRYGDFYSFAYILKDNFKSLKDKNEDSKTQIAYLRFKNIKDMNMLDLGFYKRSIRHKEYLEKQFTNRPKELFNEINNNILEELEKKEKEINDAKKELKDAENKIIDGKLKIIEGYEEYNEGKAKYDDEIDLAEEELIKVKEKLKNGEKEYNKGKKELDDANTKYINGLSEYNENLDKYNKGKQELKQAEIQLNLLKQNINKLNDLKILVLKEVTLKNVIDKYDTLVIKKQEAEIEGNLEKANQIQLEIDQLLLDNAHLGNITQIKSQYNLIQNIKLSFDNYQKNMYNLEFNTINQGNSSYIQKMIDSIPIKEEEINQGKIKLQQTKTLLDNAKTDLDKAKVKIDEGRKRLDKSKKELDDGKYKLESSLNIFNIEKQKKLNLLDSSYYDLKQAQKEIKENEEKFLKEKEKVEKEIKEAEEKINKVKEDIKKLDKPICIFNTRYDNVNYYLFYDSAKRIDLLANVFPPFLFLIALLVSLTTMTRMVDEQRQQIGTYKGLGYKNREIALKYVVYGGIAAILRWYNRNCFWF